MNSEVITQGLLIAAIGMGLVFVVIIFLWGLMALLMRLTSGREESSTETMQTEELESDLAPAFEQTEHQRRAAAAAVAVSLAAASGRKKAPVSSKQSTRGDVSPWQAFHRLRQVNPKERRG